MKFPLKFICPERRQAAGAYQAVEPGRTGAFSLIELLVAMTVLALLVIILAQIMGMASLSWALGKQRIDNLTKARVFLDLMARDVQDGVFRPDLAAFLDQTGAAATSTSTSYAFYSKRTGGGARSMTLINYLFNQGSTTYPTFSLMRGALPFAWTGAPSFAGGSTGTLTTSAFIPTEWTTLTGTSSTAVSYYSQVASGVVAFRMFFINADTTVSPATNSYSWNYLPWNYSSTGTGKSSIAVCVTMVVVDDNTEILLTNENKMATLATAFNGSVPATLSGRLKDTWDAQINTAGFFNGYPIQTRAGLKVFDRIIPLPPFYL